MDAARQYSTQDAARILQTTEIRIRNWARLGGLGAAEFTFQQLLLLRTTRGLLEAGIPPQRVRRVWSSLRRQLQGDLPLTSVRILADGTRAVAWDDNASWQPDSGQFLLDFEAEEIAARAEEAPLLKLLEPPPLPTPIHGPAHDPSTRTAEQWFELGCELEETSPLEARQAYLQAIATNATYADPCLNLGRMDHEIGELGKAEAHYRRAVQCDPTDATAHFNLGVLLEDRVRPDEAIQAYHQAIVRDPELADAHYNLGLLLEARGRRDDALKHLMAARRIYEGEPST